MIYFFVFFVSYALFLLSDKSKQYLRYLYAGLGVFVLCLLSGLRDISVGTDVSDYGLDTYYSAINNSLYEHLIYLNRSDAPLFNILVWVFANVFNSFNIVLFAIQAASIIPFYVIANKILKGNVSFCMLMYMLLIYPITLNLLKQGIAISFIIVAGYYALNKKLFPYIFFLICAIGFHLTAIIGILFYPFSVFLQKYKNVSKKIFCIYVLVFGSIFFFGESLIYLIAPLRDAYSYQINSIGKGSLNISMLLLLFIFLASNFFVFNKNKKMDMRDKYFFYIILAGFISCQFDLISESLSRFGYYGLIFLPIYLKMMIDKSNKSSILFQYIIIILVIFIFIYSIIINHNQEIYPYYSKILGIY